jgi:hypothetical protein
MLELQHSHKLPSEINDAILFNACLHEPFFFFLLFFFQWAIVRKVSERYTYDR